MNQNIELIQKLLDAQHTPDPHVRIVFENNTAYIDNDGKQIPFPCLSTKETLRQEIAEHFKLFCSGETTFHKTVYNVRPKNFA